jgi:archaellum component FlaC
MKNVIKVMVLGILVMAVLTSCAKQPAQEINDAKAAVEAAAKEGAGVYAAEDFKKLNDDLTAAMDEVNTQSKKFFKSFGTAKQMLANVKTEAEALAATIPAKKEAAKAAALTAQQEAQAAIDEAKALLGKAPKGKGTKADIEAMNADLKGVEDSFPQVQAAIDQEDYFGAANTANTIKEKAVAISDQVKAAIEKVKGKR